MTSALSPQQAIVRPRVYVPDTGDILPLEDALQAWLTKHKQSVAIIIGGAGAGKSTALAYLREQLSDHENIQFVDDADEHQHGLTETLFPPTDAGPITIGTSSTKELRTPRYLPTTAFQLAHWQQDDWIEYLLAAHPNSCSSVILRLQQADDRKLLAGNPELCRIVLDRMAADESIRTVHAALEHDLNDLFADPKLRLLAAHYSVEVLTATAQTRKQVERRATRDCGELVFRRMRHECIRNIIAAERILRAIGKSKRRGRIQLKKILPRDLIHEIAHQMDDESRRQLEEIQQARSIDVNAMAVSILVADDHNWKPTDNRIGPLVGAFVDGANWSGIDLSESALNNCDMSFTWLEGAKLDVARAISVNFTRASLNSASAAWTVFDRSCLNDAQFVSMKAQGARFNSVEAINCDFQMSQLPNTSFLDATLSNSRFFACDLEGANFVRATIDGVDFSDAYLSSAILNGLDLSKTTLAGATLQSAKLNHCNLEYLDLPDADCHKAEFWESLLTGTRMPRANFEAADFRGTGLAEVEWEGANLRDADLRGSTFHLGSSRSGRVDSYLASEGTRTGFYTDDYNEQHFKSPEEIRKANLCGADLRGAKIDHVDFYLVDLRGAKYTPEQRQQFEACGAILSDP